MTNSRGLLIVLEGCDRSGKSTQCQRLVSYLNDHRIPSDLVRFPNRSTAIGKTIDAFLSQTTDLDDRAIHLLFSANRWEMMKEMEEKLKRGVTLVVDRYAYSGIAFSAAKGMDVTWCKRSDEGMIRPDIVLFLDVAIEKAKERGGFGEERYEKEELQRRVRDMFLELKEKDWKVVDASLEVEQVWQQIQQSVDALLSKERPPLQHDLFQ